MIAFLLQLLEKALLSHVSAIRVPMIQTGWHQAHHTGGECCVSLLCDTAG